MTAHYQTPLLRCERLCSEGWDTWDRGDAWYVDRDLCCFFFGWSLGGFPLLVSSLDAGARHAFAQTAFVEKRFFQLSNLLIQQVIGLVNEANQNIRHHFGRSGIKERAKRDRCEWIMGRMGLMRPIAFSYRAVFARIIRSVGPILFP